jgi:hypothetical protein
MAGKRYGAHVKSIARSSRDFNRHIFRRQAVPVAQLDRALASGAKGCRFESCRGYFLAPQAVASLLVPQRSDRIDLGGPTCRIDRGERRDQDCEDYHGQ